MVKKEGRKLGGYIVFISIPMYYSQIGVDADNKLNAVKMLYYDNQGCNPNDATAFLVAECAPNCYLCDNWFLKPTIVLTDTASNTYMRAPG